MYEVVTVQEQDLLLVADTLAEVIDITAQAELLDVATQGPPGPPGPTGQMGPIGDSGGAFLVLNRFSEIATDETAKAQARANLGLQNIGSSNELQISVGSQPVLTGSEEVTVSYTNLS